MPAGRQGILEEWKDGRMEEWIVALMEFLIRSDSKLWMGEEWKKNNNFVKIKYARVFNNYYDNAGSPGDALTLIPKLPDW